MLDLLQKSQQFRIPRNFVRISISLQKSPVNFWYNLHASYVKNRGGLDTRYIGKNEMRL